MSNNKKRPPFIISRSNSSRSSVAFLDKSLSNSFEDPNPSIFRKQGLLSKQGSFNFHDTAFKSHASIFKTDNSIMPDLIEKYTQDNLQYRDEEFTQQAEIFITKIAADKKIPKELKAKFPLYQILISICKIFMLNEYEISVFACSLDHCAWKIDEVVLPEEADFLREFPSNFGVEVSDDCKRFIMYLLILTFSLKQYLNDKSIVDKVQAYCEKICLNFQSLFNRWTRLSSFHKFNYSAPEINRKFKFLSKRDYGDQTNTIKDYNMLVDNIMLLTGSYNSKPKPELKPLANANDMPVVETSRSPQLEKPKLFPDLNLQPILEAKNFNAEISPLAGFGLDRTFTRTKTLDLFTESPGVKIPNAMGGGNYSRQGSISNFFTSFPLLKRQNSFEFFDELNRKLLKQDTLSFPSFGNPSAMNEEVNDTTNQTASVKKETTNIQRNTLIKQGDFEELMNIALPMLSKKSSNISQQAPEELPSFSRLNSAFSFTPQ